MCENVNKKYLGLLTNKQTTGRVPKLERANVLNENEPYFRKLVVPLFFLASL